MERRSRREFCGGKVGENDGVDAVGGEGMADGGVGRGRNVEALHQGNLAGGASLVENVSIMVIQIVSFGFGGVDGSKRDVGERAFPNLGAYAARTGR